MPIAGEARLFADWFGGAHQRLRALPPERVADAFYDQLAALGLPFSVEVSRSDLPDGPHYDVIFSAEGERSRFPDVRELVATAPRVQGFHVTALRPARGFQFSLTTAGITVEPEHFRFLPLESPGAPGAIGIRLYVQDEMMTLASLDLAMRILETGIGEQDAAAIAHLEMEPLHKAARSASPIHELGAWVAFKLSEN